MRTREREVYSEPWVDKALGDNYAYILGNWVYLSTMKQTLGAKLIALDSCRDETHKGPPYYSGGPLHVRHWIDETKARIVHGPISLLSANLKRRYEGIFYVDTKFLDTYSPVSGEVLNVLAQDYSARAWSRLRPDRPLASLAQFIGEMKDVPRMLKTTAETFKVLYNDLRSKRFKGLNPKELSNEWLNANFGWLPFVNDLGGFIKAVKTWDDRYARYKKNAGRWIKRKVRVASGSEFVEHGSDTGVNHIFPALTTYFYSSSDPHQCFSRKWGLQTDVEVWAEGSVKYYLPNMPDHKLKRLYLMRLLGLELNPQLVWELTPWSWLVDWFSNMGDLFENVSSSNYIHNNFVSRYSYVMCTSTLCGKLEAIHRFANAEISCALRRGNIVKTRREASPFGFNVDWGDLSSRQISILGALGVTKSRRFY